MTAQEILGRISGLLEAAGIPWMLTGSFASAYHGEPRASQDLDFVIAPTPDQLRRFVGLLPAADYYVSIDAALEALEHGSQFNVIDASTGWKVDLIIRKSRAFSREEFDRRRPVDMGGGRLYMATAEDVIIAKLEWAQRGESRRQFEDVAGILRVRTDLDHAYLDRWIRDLHLEKEWKAAAELAAIR